MGNMLNGSTEKSDGIILEFDHGSMMVHPGEFDVYHAIRPHRSLLSLLKDIESLRIRSESKAGDAEASATLSVIYSIGLGFNGSTAIQPDMRKSQYYAQDKVFMTSLQQSDRVIKMLDFAEMARKQREKDANTRDEVSELKKKLNT